MTYEREQDYARHDFERIGSPKGHSEGLYVRSWHLNLTYKPKNNTQFFNPSDDSASQNNQSDHSASQKQLSHALSNALLNFNKSLS